jgi:thiamine-phosphate pyrophosphorylase
MDRDTGRIIDANLNRVTEGLRVIEDVERYGRDHAAVQQRLKALRHRIASEVDAGRYIRYRDPSGDVGYASTGALENRRGSVKDLVRSNMKRVQEGLRVLEETMKLHSPALSLVMKQCRYESYEIEKIISLAEEKRLGKGLYLILTGPARGYDKMTTMAAEARLLVVQLRAKGIDDREALRIAKAMREITRGTETLFIVNDRVDIAHMAGADGVHLGQGTRPRGMRGASPGRA